MRTLAHAPTQLMRSDVRDREGILSCPLVFKCRASVLLSCRQDKPLNCFQPVSRPSADREKDRTAIESNGTRRVYVFLIENQGKVLERRWWTHLQCEALAFCTRTMEIVSPLMDRWRGITDQFHFLPSIRHRLLRKEKKTQSVQYVASHLWQRMKTLQKQELTFFLLMQFTN